MGTPRNKPETILLLISCHKIFRKYWSMNQLKTQSVNHIIDIVLTSRKPQKYSTSARRANIIHDMNTHRNTTI